MGNEQKNSNKKNKIKNQNIYLLCPNCFKKVPILNTFIEGESIKIKISCTCLDSNTFLIMNLIEYLSIINNYINNNFCIYHEKILSQHFCINCEKWLCKECFNNHSIDICKKAYLNNNIDNEEIFCPEHKSKKIYLCKKCLIIFCKICFIHHNTRNKIKHKGKNIECYLTEHKINEKYNKLQLYINEIVDLKSAIKNELLKEFIEYKDKDTKEIKNFLINFQEKYLLNKSINEQLKLLFELILKNSQYVKAGFINNKKFIYNVITNIKLNKVYPKFDKNLSIIEQMKYFINFNEVNYINGKNEYNFKLINKIENANSIVEKMISLPDNKFVIFNRDCQIKIYKLNLDKNEPPKKIFSLNEHTNNITCIIVMRNSKYFATASDDCTIKIWDSEKGVCIKTISVEGKPFLIYEKFQNKNQIGCVPNRNSLTIYKYDEKSQNTLLNISLEKTIPWIEGLYQFHKDGRIIISSSGFFDIFSKELKLIKRIYIANCVPQIFSELKNEDLLVGSSSKEVFIYDKNLNFKRKLIGHTKTITSFIELNENLLLTSSLDSSIILWRIGDYEMIVKFINNSFGINSMIKINDFRIITCSFYKINFINEWEIEKV
jgi:hypothetical protein